MTGLALFDIDGTLTVSNEIDTECFVDAFRDEFGLTDIPVGWQHYEHSTDRGIAMQILRTEESVSRHRVRFVASLRKRAREIVPVGGALEFLDAVREAGWSIAIITGAWSDSARLKLDAARISGYDVFSCDTILGRPDIIRCALDRIAVRPVVLFGDGPWDYAAARELGIGFIGIGDKTGASETFEDYRDRERMLDAMLRSAR